MIKELIKSIRRKLLKIDWVKREVEDYIQKLRKQRHYEKWAQLMHSGCKVRNLRPSKLELFESSVILLKDGGVENLND